MKELSIEEKAKAYDIALDKIKMLLGTGSSCSREELEYVFPELKESEDDRIRKAISDILLIDSDEIREILDANNILMQDIDAWLEKKKEEHEIKYIYPKFRIGDVIVEIKPNGYCQPVKVKYVGEGSYSCESEDGKRFLCFPIISQDEYKLVEQPTDNDIKEALRTEYEKGRADAIAEFQKEWSEEDENTIKFLISHFCSCHPTRTFQFTINEVITHDELLRKIRHLKPQMQWKPSDEQLNALDNARHSNPFDVHILDTLFHDLKKLK